MRLHFIPVSIIAALPYISIVAAFSYIFNTAAQVLHFIHALRHRTSSQIYLLIIQNPLVEYYLDVIDVCTWIVRSKIS